MIDFDKIIWENLPIVLRKLRLYSLVKSIVKPVVTLFENFSFLAQFTSELSSLEHYLNAVYGYTYDINDRDTQIANTDIIWIDSIVTKQSPYLYNFQENLQKVYLRNFSELANPTYFYNASEIDPGHNFIVYVPASLVFDNDLMISRINQYKVSGKKFIIQTY